jgi:hypothetical protein
MTGVGSGVSREPTVVDDTGTGASAEVSGDPTAVADTGTGAGVGVAVGVGRWSRGGTPSSTSEEHNRMEQPQPSSSWFPCVHGLHRP